MFFCLRLIVGGTMDERCDSCGHPLPPVRQAPEDEMMDRVWFYAKRENGRGAEFVRVSPPCEKCGKRTEMPV